MVLLGHGSATMWGIVHRDSLRFLLFFFKGQRGVTIFFVISGFLITSLLVREQIKTGTISIKDFYARRAFRIFPAFYAYWIVILGLVALKRIWVPLTDLLSSACYVWNYTPRVVDSWFLGHTWSLSVEEQFYLFWPLVLKLAGVKRAKYIAISVILASPVIRVATYFLIPWFRPRIGMMLHTRADALMLGALLALLCFSEEHAQQLKRAVSSWMVPAGVLAFFIVDSVLLRFHGSYLLPIGYSLQNIFIGLLIAHVVFFPTTILGKMLNNRIVAHIGVISYSLYLWQQLFLTTLNTTPLGKFPLNFLCAFAVAELSYRIIERPFLNLRQRLFPGEQRSAPIARVATAD